MPTYSFSFYPDASGLDYKVKNRAGVVVDTGTLPEGDDVSLSLELPWDSYLAYTEIPSGPYESTQQFSASGSIAAGGGGGGTTDGVGAVFFGGGDLDSPIDNTYYFSDFESTDDPPRAPQRDDLMVIDGEDNTVINVVRSGLYDISLNVPVQPNNLVVPAEGGPYRLEAVVQVWVSGNSYPPAYDYNNRAQWDVKESATSLPTVFTNWTFPQVLLEGDTIQLAVKSYATGLGDPLTGSVILDPDITFVLTYRGPVDLEA